MDRICFYPIPCLASYYRECKIYAVWIEIARTEQYHEGTIPLQTMRADIDYGFAEAKTTYGRVGVNVWLYKGEVLHDNRRPRKEKEGGTK